MTKVHIKVRKGCTRIMGLAFSKDVSSPVTRVSMVHSDCVIGDPSSPSDSRLKHNQQPVPVEKLKNIFDSIETMEYDFKATWI